ncbi:hypothetical protein T492DRAFT_888469 [Pavlovales sp. CCMP2436]|nr:hypothetical protein T492DRAFT_888469 [Pavlovales sp. CCMP2436]
MERSRFDEAGLTPIIGRFVVPRGEPPAAHLEGGSEVLHSAELSTLFQPSFCIAHDEVQWSTCAGIIGADTVFWDPQLAVPMHEPTAADAGLVKGPLNSISHTSVGCQIVARRFSCYASWGECTPSVTQTVITRSGGQYEYDGNVWPGKVLTSAADVDKFVLKAPRDLCEGYMAGCSEEERTDAYEKFFNLLHLFRSITKRTDEEGAIGWFVQDGSAPMRYGPA